MARLAEYLSQLAVLYGARESVHFDRLLKGSVIVQAWIPRTEAEIVVDRVKSAQSPDAPEDVRRSYQKIDAMLRENQVSGEIKRRSGGKILVFPGAKLPAPRPIIVTDYAEVDGVVVRVGGTDNTIPVHLQTAAGEVLPCQVRNRLMARELASFLYGEPIRVRGRGQWERSAEGAWKMIVMTIDAWDTLDEATLTQTLDALRTISENGWKQIDDTELELRRIRDGR